jgi:large subunit ribosomal protein L10
MPTQAKVAEVEELVRELTGARSVLLADFTGMDVASLSDLRRRCRAENVYFRVARNTLSKRALKSVGMEAIEELLEGPTGIAVARGEELAAARVLIAFAKEKERPRVKGGLIEGRVYSLAEIKILASLPARKDLLSQVLMVFEAPVTQVIGSLSRLLSDVVSILDQLGSRGGGDSAPAASGDSPAAATAESAPAAPAAAEEAKAEA